MTTETMVDPAELAAVKRAFPPLEHARAIREAAEATQEWLGVQIGVDASCVSHYEAGRKRPRPHHLIRWFYALAQLERVASVTAAVREHS